MRKLNLFLILGCLLAAITTAQTYTIALQPSSPGYDAILNSASGTTNYGTDTKIRASRNTSSQYERSLLKFDLAGIPANASVVTASLILYGSNHTTAVSNAAYLQIVLGTWNEGTINWNTGSGFSNTTGQIALPAAAGTTDNYTINVATALQAMLNTQNLNFGWHLKMQTESNVNNAQMEFYSSDDATPANRPKLVVTYQLPIDVNAYVIPSYSTSTSDGSVNLSVSGGTPPFTYAWSNSATTKDVSGLAPGLYTVTVTDANSFQAKKIIPVSTANGNNGSFTITSDGLSFKDSKVQTASLNSNIANTNYGTLNTNHVIVQNQASGWNIARSEIAFDLNAIPSNAVIATAVLKLTTLNPSTTSLYLTPITQSWNENTVTWNNQPATDDANSIPFNVTSGTTVYTLNVAAHVQKMVQQGTSLNGWQLRLQSEATGTNYLVPWKSSDNTSGFPELSLVYTLPSTNYDHDYNWTNVEVFDENGNVTSASKTYIDGLGRTTQNLTKNAFNEVLTTQTVYDQYGRPALNTLPAYTGNSLIYQENFFKNSSNVLYSYRDYDTTTTLNNPNAAQTSSVNSLGYYYSDNNTYDTYQATATQPYTRVEYTGDPSGNGRRVTKPGNQFKMGSGREDWSFSTITGNELKAIFGTSNSYKISFDPDDFNSTSVFNTGNIIASKNISIGPDRKETISYSVNGKIIATCLSGLSTDNCSITGVKSYMNYYGTKSVDVHLPDADKTSLTLPLPTYTIAATPYTASSSDISYIITDLYTDKVLVLNTDYTFNTGTRAVTFDASFLALYTGRGLMLRISFALGGTLADDLEINNGVISDAEVAYSLDYGRWSVNYYDLAGNLRKEVSPKGINCSSPGSITMATTYDYSHLGLMIAKNSPDEGLVEYNYDSEGKLRYSQNALQHSSNRFSYINYDSQGRTVETGEYTTGSTTGSSNVYFQNYYSAYSAPNTGNVTTLSGIDNLDALSLDAKCSDVFHTMYEAPTGGDDIPSGYTYKTQYNTKYLNGMVCKTWNANTATWYNYDAMGRNTATVKQILDATYTDIKTNVDDQIKVSETVYNNFNSTVSKSIYQLNEGAEKMEITSVYDALLRPYQTYMNSPAGSGVKINETKFDKLGRAIRTVVGNNLQGIDMVYTLDSKLKAINHPGLDYTLDRGADNGDYTGAIPATVNKDLFGEILEYHYLDYEAPNTYSINSISSGSSKYDGLLYSQRFKTANDVNGVTGADYIDHLGGNQLKILDAPHYIQKELMFSYTYDQYKQLATSTFGTYYSGTNTFTSRTEYKESGASGGNIGYDANGNINRMVRSAYIMSGSLVNYDDLTYTVSSTSNKLTHILDAATNTFDRFSNFKTPSTSVGSSLTYNSIGQLTASSPEGVNTITYYPNGKPKKITFTNNNYTEYFNDDNGEKYKVVFHNDSLNKNKVTWYVGPAIYILDEVVSMSAINLEEMETPVGQIKKNGSVYEAIYKITDHLGNVRVTFKESGVGNGINLLNWCDYYAWGGTLPGRNHIGTPYRYGYQGKEKAEDWTLWDKFELRLYNHDIGRWMTPDPYGQFTSPYIAMSNNPASNTDPDGGYSITVNRTGEGGRGASDFLLEMRRKAFFELYKGVSPLMVNLIWHFQETQDNLIRLGVIPYYGQQNDYIDDGSEGGVLNWQAKEMAQFSNGSTAANFDENWAREQERKAAEKSSELQYRAQKELVKKSKVEASAEEMERLKDFISWNKINWAKPISTYEAYVMKFSPDNPIKATWFLETKEEKENSPKPGIVKWFNRVVRGIKDVCSNAHDKITSRARGSNYNQRKAFWNDIRKWINKHSHLSMGLRIGNTVLFDIRANSTASSDWVNNFPGRAWLPWNKNNAGVSRAWRFSIIPYRVYQNQTDSYYPSNWREHNPAIGTYSWFLECSDINSHKK